MNCIGVISVMIELLIVHAEGLGVGHPTAMRQRRTLLLLLLLLLNNYIIIFIIDS